MVANSNHTSNVIAMLSQRLSAGANKILKQIYPLYIGVVMTFVSSFQPGTNIYERDWDILILMDTCRVDALREVAPEYAFLEKEAIDSIWSVGSTSSTFISNTFVTRHKDEIKNTIYISDNNHTTRVIRDRVFIEEEKNAPFAPTKWDTVDISDFQKVEETHKVTGGAASYEENTIRMVTDRVIDNYRRVEPDRLVVHYLSPHSPYRSNSFKENRELYDYERSPWEYLRNGGDKSKVWNAYLDDIRMVLDEIKLIVNNVDANIVISADHGELFGELGVLFSHPAGVFHPSLRKVPWVEVKGHSREEYEPEHTEEITGRGENVEDQLRRLGYI